MAAVFRAIFGYLFLIFMVRIVGRRPGKQITPFEFVLVFFMGGVTLTAMVADDRSLTNALCQIVTVAAMHYLIAWARQRSTRFGLVTDGTPLTLLTDGQQHVETMKRMRIQAEDIRAMMRDQGLERVDQVDYAVLERNGEISIVPSKDS